MNLKKSNEPENIRFFKYFLTLSKWREMHMTHPFLVELSDHSKGLTLLVINNSEGFPREGTCNARLGLSTVLLYSQPLTIWVAI